MYNTPTPSSELISYGLGYDCWIRYFWNWVLKVAVVSFDMWFGTEFQDFIVLYIGLFSNLLVWWVGMFSFPAWACRVLLVGWYCWYSEFMFGGFSFSRDLCVKTDSCIARLWCRDRNFSLCREAVAESYFLFPVIDLAAKFWTICNLLLFVIPHPPHTTSA